MICAPNEGSDQPGHPPSLIRVFAVRMKKAWVPCYPLSFVDFVMRRLMYRWAPLKKDEIVHVPNPDVAANLKNSIYTITAWNWICFNGGPTNQTGLLIICIFEPDHEIMSLFVLCKLIHSHPVGLDVWFWSNPPSTSTGVQLLVFFCSSVPVVLFDTPGISRCRSPLPAFATAYFPYAKYFSSNARKSQACNNRPKITVCF